MCQRSKYCSNLINRARALIIMIIECMTIAMGDQSSIDQLESTRHYTLFNILSSAFCIYIYVCSTVKSRHQGRVQCQTDIHWKNTNQLIIRIIVYYSSWWWTVIETDKRKSLCSKWQINKELVSIHSSRIEEKTSTTCSYISFICHLMIFDWLHKRPNIRWSNKLLFLLCST